MKLDVLVYVPGVILPRPQTVWLPDVWGFRELNDTFKPIIGGDVENIERVAVLFRDQPRDMFVDEFGAISLTTRPPLPVNETATLIYQEASRRRGWPLGGPQIHGVAVLCVDQRVWD